MKLLDAVNLVLPKLGEHPVTSLTVKNPTLGVILPEVENSLISLLLKGWWFNRFKYTAPVQEDSEIVLGDEVLSFIPGTEPAVLRGGKLYNSETRLYSWTVPVAGVVTERVPFEELPESAARAVLYNALVTVFVEDIGMAQEVQAWMTLAAQSYSDLLAEHLRHSKHSTRNSGRFRRLRNALQGS